MWTRCSTGFISCVFAFIHVWFSCHSCFPCCVFLLLEKMLHFWLKTKWRAEFCFCSFLLKNSCKWSLKVIKKPFVFSEMQRFHLTALIYMISILCLCLFFMFPSSIRLFPLHLHPACLFLFIWTHTFRLCAELCPCSSCHVLPLTEPLVLLQRNFPEICSCFILLIVKCFYFGVSSHESRFDPSIHQFIPSKYWSVFTHWSHFCCWVICSLSLFAV